MAIERGSLLNKRYRILEILGQGGMGSIYRAVDENLGVDVAVKENLFTTEEYARQFRREALILANLRHPNLPRVTDHFVIDGQGQYLIMDYIEGEDLRERMDREGVLPDTEVVILGAAICEALCYLHSRSPQIVHRDIKPGNVKVSPAGQIILVDFGLAKVAQSGEMTTTGARAMTPGYSPPEQYGTARTDHRTDIYSLGATLYVALTGFLPEDALARAMEQAQLTPIRKHNPKVSRRLAGVIEKALELRPDDRFQSAEDFKQALLNTRGITGRRQAVESSLPPPPQVSPARVGSAGGAGEAIAMAGEVAWPSPSPAGYTPSQLPASSPFVDRPQSTPRRKRPWGVVFTLIAAGLLFFSSVGAYYYRPELLDQALAWLAPVLTTNTLTPTATSPPPSATPQPAVTPTQNQQMSQGDIPIWTPAPTLETSPTPPPPSPTPGPTDTPTIAATPIGGGSGQIAFASDRSGLAQIWMMNSDGTGLQQITDMPEGACQPAWAPDGLRLAFISPCSSNQESYPGASLFIIDVNGANLITLPTMPGGDFDPAWSPEGKEIAFTSFRDYNRPQVYVINVEDNSIHSVSENTVRDYQPAWSPDGEKIVFVSTRRGPSQLWTMSRDGSNPELFSRSGSLKNSHPVWSPDGQVITYNQVEVLGGIPRLMSARYGNPIFSEKRIISEMIPMREAAYSPDGLWLAFESWPTGADHHIYIMTTNGLARQQLTSDPGNDFDPAWRPALQQP